MSYDGDGDKGCGFGGFVLSGPNLTTILIRLHTDVTCGWQENVLPAAGSVHGGGVLHAITEILVHVFTW